MLMHVMMNGLPRSAPLVGLCGARVEGIYVSKVGREATRAHTCPVCRSIASEPPRESSRPSPKRSARVGRDA
jgi:hypothetical protein